MAQHSPTNHRLAPQITPPVATRRNILKGITTVCAISAISQRGTADQHDGTTVYLWSDNLVLHGINTVTGGQIWEWRHPDADRFSIETWSAPTVVDGTVYVGISGGLYAINAGTGEDEWSEFEFPDRNVGSPTIIGDSVFVIVNYAGGGCSVYKLNKDTGEITWEWQSDTQPLSSISNSIHYYQNTVYFVTDEQVYGLNGQTGEQEWTFNHSLTTARTTPTAYQNSIYYIGEDNQSSLYSIDIESAEREWMYQGVRSFEDTASPVVVDGIVLVVGQTTDGTTLDAVEAESGERIWRFNGLDLRGPSRSPITTHNGHIYIGDRNYLYKIDGAGNSVWEFETNAPVVGIPTVYSNSVYFATRSESGLYAVNTQNGDQRWAYTDFNGAVHSSPTVISEVDGNSVGSRIILGTLGHTDAWQGETPDGYELEITESLNESEGDQTPAESTPTEPTDEQPGTTSAEDPAGSATVNAAGDDDQEGSQSIFFRQTENILNNVPGLIGGGVGIVGLGYLAYRRVRNTDKDTNQPVLSISQPDSSTQPMQNPNTGASTSSARVSSYAELQIGELIKTTEDTQLSTATVNREHIWVLTPAARDETIPTDQFDGFLERVEPWAQIDDHPNLLSVYGYGTDPLPWVAIEPHEKSPISEWTEEFSYTEILDIIIHICEGIHHIHRYGLAYEHLSPSSILLSDTAAVTLRGILDHIEATSDRYELPTSDEDPTAEQADVYRIGALLYEIRTGSPPQRSTRSLPAESTSSLPVDVDTVLETTLAEDPTDRYETVLHLRDELQNILDRL